MAIDVPGKVPTELFGHNTQNEPGREIKARFAAQHCPFLGKECNKPRKSQPKIKIGTCSLGYQGRNQVEYKPVIVCPHRFEASVVFDSIRREFFPGESRIKWVREVKIGHAGSVDFVAAVLDGQNRIKKYLCVEIQAGGTTGTPYGAVDEYLKGFQFTKNSYNYGINWANEYVKTMMQQALKKGKIVAAWKKQIVFVLQDIGMEYIMSTGSGVVKACEKHPVQFRPFSLTLNKQTANWELQPSPANYSADLDGIRALLSGSDELFSESQFLESLLHKGTRDKVFPDDKAPSPPGRR